MSNFVPIKLNTELGKGHDLEIGNKNKVYHMKRLGN